MRAAMAHSQFATLQAPAVDETDVGVIDASRPIDALVARAVAAVAGLHPGLDVEPLLADGATDRTITSSELQSHLAELVRAVAPGHLRVLLVPPDHTRLHSRAGEIAMHLRTLLTAAGCEVGVLPALGTH